MSSLVHKSKVPSYRHHRPTGQAVVTLNGKDHYLLWAFRCSRLWRDPAQPATTTGGSGAAGSNRQRETLRHLPGRPNKEGRPYTHQPRRPPPVRIPGTLCLRHWHALDRQRKVVGQMVQITGHIAEAHRLPAHAGDRGVHETHGQAEGRDAEPASQSVETSRRQGGGQQGRNQPAYQEERITRAAMIQKRPHEDTDYEERDRQQIMPGLRELPPSSMQAGLRGVATHE